MALSFPQFISMLLFFVIAYGAFSCWDKTKKIYCTFKSNDRSEESRWIKKSLDKIIFKGSDGVERWYDLEAGRTTMKLFTGGIHVIFRIHVRCLTFRQDSRRPEDPFTFNNTMDGDPAMRALLNAKDDTQEFAQQTQKGFGGKVKGGLLQQWMPIIMIAGFAILGLFIFQQQQRIDLLGTGQNVMEQMLQQLLARP